MPNHRSRYADRILIAAMKRRGLRELGLRALHKAHHLLALALGESLRQLRGSADPLQATLGQLQEHTLLLRLEQETSDILASRWDKIPERRRPYYTPETRFRILRLKALLALSAQETARRFRVCTNTVLNWEREAAAAPEKQTVGSLLKPVPPVRRYADLVRHTVQSMILAGFPGHETVAQTLARMSWTLAKSTVHRISSPSRSPLCSMPSRACR